MSIIVIIIVIVTVSATYTARVPALHTQRIFLRRAATIRRVYLQHCYCAALHVGLRCNTANALRYSSRAHVGLRCDVTASMHY
jgi:hypothetical protein